MELVERSTSVGARANQLVESPFYRAHGDFVESSSLDDQGGRESLPWTVGGEVKWDVELLGYVKVLGP